MIESRMNNIREMNIMNMNITMMVPLTIPIWFPRKG